MKAYEIIRKIEKFAPLALACEWDNPGFLCGNKEKEVKKVLLSLDINLDTVNEAISEKADMIISHHPMFFSGLKRIDFSTTEGKIVELLIKNGISVYAAHTNMDAAENGINQKLAEIFELSDIAVLEPYDEKTGIGRFGNLKEEMPAKDFAALVKEKLNTPYVRVIGEKKINRLAICSGSGADYFRLALKNGCDALLTGDVKYHTALDAKDAGVCIIDAGHFPTEKLVCEIFSKILEECSLEIVVSREKDAFELV